MGKRTACGFFVAAVMSLLASCASTCPDGLVRDPSNPGQCRSTPEPTAEGDSSDALIIDMLKEDCSAGSAEACTDLGELYLTGITVTDNGTARASRRVLDGESYLRRACDREHARACVKLADAYGTDDVLKNPEKAMEYYGRACSLGWEPSCKRVAGHQDSERQTDAERQSRLQRLSMSPCSRARAREELELASEDRAVDDAKVEQAFAMCVASRIQECQVALDSHGVASAISCWSKDAWSESPAGFEAGAFANTRACLNELSRVESDLTQCIASRPSDDMGLVDRLSCLLRGWQALHNYSCPLLETASHLLAFEKATDYMREIEAAREPGRAAACRLLLANIDEALVDEAVSTAEESYEVAVDQCTAKDEVKRLKQARTAIAKTRKQVAEEQKRAAKVAARKAQRTAKCGGATPLELLINLQNGFRVKRAVGCTYEAPYLHLQYFYTKKRRKFVVDVSGEVDASMGPALIILSTSEDFVDGAVVTGRQVRFSGIERVFLEDDWANLPAFRLVD